MISVVSSFPKKTKKKITRKSIKVCDTNLKLDYKERKKNKMCKKSTNGKKKKLKKFQKSKNSSKKA